MILRGDLIYTLNILEVWGSSARVDKLVDFFHYNIEVVGLIEIEPISMGPTYKNNRVGDESVTKRIDRFLILDALLQGVGKYRSYIGANRCPDHNTIFIELILST